MLTQPYQEFTSHEVVEVSPIIDGKVIGNTPILLNSRMGSKFMVTKITVVPENITGFTVAPTVNIGKTGPGYSDIRSALGLSFAAHEGRYSRKDPEDNAVFVDFSETLYCRVATPATSQAYTFQVVVEGIYFS